MKESTLGINHLPAPCVTTSAQHHLLWRDMKEPTLVINHSAAPSVTTNAQPQLIWRSMRELKRVIDHSAAPSVTTNAQIQVLWRAMKEPIRGINHFNAPNTSRYSVKHPTLGDMKKVTKCWHLFHFFKKSKKSLPQPAESLPFPYISCLFLDEIKLTNWHLYGSSLPYLVPTH